MVNKVHQVVDHIVKKMSRCQIRTCEIFLYFMKCEKGISFSLNGQLFM